MDTASPFPPLPSVKAQWAPIYLEVLPGSGERLAIATVALEGRRFSIAPALDSPVIACMYGAHAERVQYFVDAILESLSDHFEDGGSIAEWAPPYADTTYVGPASEAYGDSLKEIAEGGLILASSLSIVPRRMIPQMAFNEPSEGTRLDRWAGAVRQAVLSFRPGWENRFGHVFQVKPGAAPIRVGYAGPRVAAHFLRLGQSSLSKRHKDGKGKLFDLESLRLHDGIAPRSSYELLISRPSTPSDDCSDRDLEDMESVARDLEYFADKHDLRVETMASATAAANRLMTADAA